MVLTHPEFRGRGFAKRLLEHVLRRADAAGIRTLKLDATNQGKPLYEKYDFRSEQAVERWGGKCDEVGVAGSLDIKGVGALDTRAFGVNRSVLLQALASRGSRICSGGGFLMTRTGRSAGYLGPCVARNAKAARDLLLQCSRRPEVKVATDPRESEVRQLDEWYWDLLPDNKAAVEMASELGFTRKRQLTRMVRGKNFRGADELVYAIAGFEIG
jgi:hypothetical protein